MLKDSLVSDSFQMKAASLFLFCVNYRMNFLITLDKIPKRGKLEV